MWCSIIKWWKSLIIAIFPIDQGEPLNILTNLINYFHFQKWNPKTQFEKWQIRRKKYSEHCITSFNHFMSIIIIIIIIIITLFWVQKSRNSSVDYTFKRMNVVSQWGSISHLCNIIIQTQIHNKIHIWIGTFKVVYKIVQVGTNCLISLNTDW